jgi:tRNA pseudouridine55 synthase
MSEGVLNLDKPRGPTSHDIVDRVRTLTGIRRVGHAGTLDPLATGVLLVCIGRATRVAEYLAAGKKTYRARLLLGVATDTFDAEGEVIAEEEVSVERSELERALASLRGTVEQLPPMYSALKHRGEPLHRLARRGETVERNKREIQVYALDLKEWDPPECTLELTCSPGTYVRVLAHDLGLRLGCGAHLTALTRLASGAFHLSQSISLDQLTRAAAEQRWEELLLPIDAAVSHLPMLTFSKDGAHRICSGQGAAGAPPAGDPNTLARAYGPDGTFLAIVAFQPDSATWKPRKVFARAEH